MACPVSLFLTSVVESCPHLLAVACAFSRIFADCQLFMYALNKRIPKVSALICLRLLLLSVVFTALAVKGADQGFTHSSRDACPQVSALFNESHRASLGMRAVITAVPKVDSHCFDASPLHSTKPNSSPVR